MVVESKELLARLQELYPNEDVRILNAFLSLKNHDLKATIEHYDSVKAWRQEIGPVTMEDVAPFIHSGDPYMVCLESGHLDGASETHAPIILLNGMIKGSKKDMEKQVIYAVERAWANMPPGTCFTKFIVNARGPGFRIPDWDYRCAVFDTMRYHYPWLIACRVVFVDVPKIVKGGFTVASKIFDKVMTDRFFMSTLKTWINDDPDIKIYVETTNPEYALRWSDKGIRHNVEHYLKERIVQEGGKENYVLERSRQSESTADSDETRPPSMYDEELSGNLGNMKDADIAELVDSVKKLHTTQVSS